MRLRERVVCGLQLRELGVARASVLGELVRLDGELGRRTLGLSARELELLSKRVELELWRASVYRRGQRQTRITNFGGGFSRADFPEL